MLLFAFVPCSVNDIHSLWLKIAGGHCTIYTFPPIFPSKMFSLQKNKQNLQSECSVILSIQFAIASKTKQLFS